MRLSAARKAFLLGGGAVVALASAALAQTPPATATQVAAAENANTPNTAERVLVTARRRAEDPQMVPVSLSVINGLTLERT